MKADADTFRRFVCHVALAVATCIALGNRASALLDAPPSDLPPNTWSSTTATDGKAELAPGEFSLGIGYAHISIGDSDSLLHSQDALRFDAMWNYAPFRDLPQLRLGAGFGTDLVLDNSEFVFVSNGGAVFAGHADIPLFLLEPEFRVSWQQFFGNDQSFYIEPGIGIGGVFGNLNVDADDTNVGKSFDEWASAFAVRVFVNIGFHAEGGLAGVQMSYMRGGELDFAQNASGEIDEFYIGIYGALRF